MSKVIEKLKNDADYYGEFGSKYLSNSSVGVLLSNPKLFGVKQPPTVPMLRGSYFHTAILEPHKLDSFEIVEASTRSTNIYKDAVSHSSSEILLLKNEVEDLEEMIKTIKSNFYFYENIYREGNIFEEPAIGEIFGLPFKGKADIVSEDILIDIKTTSSVRDFRYSAKKYNYDSQCYIYSQLFGKPLVFYVIDSATKELAVYEPSEDFVLGGRDKVMRAIEVYKKFFSKDATEDINNYFIQETL
jgi:hypothetical protein